jgi:chemotaxis protein methyltransferase CheR
MSHSLSDTLLPQLSEAIAAQMGLYFPKERWRDLERGMRSAARELGFHNIESCAQWMVSSPLTKSQLEVLASYLTVGETYFFRERRGFAVLEEHILPALIHARRATDKRLRLWSAGCCTGEEPYSLAILLSRVIPDWQDWHITILATDINANFLQKAASGVYGAWSFRDAPPEIRERYFRRTQEGRFEIFPELKKMVTFSSLNLAEDTYPSLLNNTNAMDVIFCRNVLMYFAPEQAKRCIQKLYHSLVDGGWLLVSPTEVSPLLFSPFVPVNFSGVTLYRKTRVGETESGRSGETKIGSEERWETKFPDSPIPRFPHSVFAGAEEHPQGEELQPTPPVDAEALYEQGRYAEAVEKLVGWLVQDQDDVKAMTLLARAYANQGKLAEALGWCDRAIATDKLNVRFHYLRATILQEQGALAEATRSLKGALYLDPDFALAHFALGSLAQRQGKLRESQKHFENALALLRACPQEEIVPESEGMTAGRLIEVIVSTAKVNGNSLQLT